MTHKHYDYGYGDTLLHETLLPFFKVQGFCFHTLDIKELPYNLEAELYIEVQELTLSYLEGHMLATSSHKSTPKHLRRWDIYHMWLDLNFIDQESYESYHKHCEEYKANMKVKGMTHYEKQQMLSLIKKVDDDGKI